MHAVGSGTTMEQQHADHMWLAAGGNDFQYHHSGGYEYYSGHHQMQPFHPTRESDLLGATDREGTHYEEKPCSNESGDFGTGQCSRQQTGPSLTSGLSDENRLLPQSLTQTVGGRPTSPSTTGNLPPLPRKLTREEKRRLRRASIKYRRAHATRERLRVEAFNSAFCTLRQLLPTLPPDKKLSKIEILRLAICYITYLNNVLDPDSKEDEDDQLDCYF